MNYQKKSVYSFDAVKITSYTSLLIHTEVVCVVSTFYPLGSFAILEIITQKTDLTTVLTHTRTGIYYRFIPNNFSLNVIHFCSLRWTTWES